MVQTTVRWVSRCSLMLLFAGSVFFWVFSYFISTGVTYAPKSYAFTYGITIESGGLYLLNIPPGGQPPGLQVVTDKPGPRIDSPPWYFLGFNAGSFNAFVEIGFFRAPLWFLACLSGLLLWLAWRKTRPKVKGRAFPVESAKP
jgi:hypothetical protein